jgi:hypothetical protein
LVSADVFGVLFAIWSSHLPVNLLARLLSMTDHLAGETLTSEFLEVAANSPSEECGNPTLFSAGFGKTQTGP